MSERNPVFNRLNSLSRGRRVVVVSSLPFEVDPRIIEGRFMGVTPSLNGPLMLQIVHSDGNDGFIPFAGSSEGIDSIIDPKTETPVFHNSNVPIPWFKPGGIDLRRGDGELEQRQVNMGLYPDIESLRKAKEESSR